MRTGLLVLGTLAAIAATPAAARSNCAAMTVRMTATTRAADARLVTGTGQRTTASDVSYVMTEPGWRLIWATPKDAERGVFFFRTTGKSPRLVDTWGGVIAPDERAGTAKWARALKGGGPSPALSACFAQAVADGK